MGDVCEKCGRPRGLIRMRECGAFHGHLYPTYGYECDAFAAGKERGMREGFAIAEEWADPTWTSTSTPTNDVLTSIDWAEARDELERRVRGGE